MANISAYQDNKKIMESKINDEYYFVETYNNNQELFWFENPPQKLPPNQIRVWLRNITTNPNITVMPDWKLVINKVEMNREAHLELKLKYGDTIELFYKNYRFIIELL